ncbi:MAG: LuxR C-terminal-related transcriptional regulator [Actinomycetota bacterium]
MTAPTDHRPSRDQLVADVVARLIGTASSPISVVLRGPAGIGKSHTARQVLAALVAEGAVEDGEASGVQSITIRRLAGGAGVQSIAFGALLPALPPDLEPVNVEFELVQRLRAALVPQGVDHRVIAIDDIGLIDEKSAGLIEMLLRHGDITVLATERTTFSGAPEEHALSQALRDVAVAVDVPALDDDELAELIAEWAGPGELSSIRRLVSVSEGNPLAARELLIAAGHADAIVERDGLWHLDGFHPVGHPLERLVGEHLRRLDAADWELVRCVAVADALPDTVATRIDDSAVERLRRAGLLTGSPIVLGHPLYGEVTRATMTSDEVRQICRKLVASVTPDDDVEPARLGSWLLTAGDVVDDEIARRGARGALARWENDLACDLLTTIADPTASDLVVLLWANANSGRLDQASDFADRAVAAAGDDAERVEAVLARSELLCLQLGRAEEGYAQLLELRESLTDPAHIARVDGATALYSHMTGNRDLAIESVARVRDASDEGTSDDARVAMLLGEAFGHVFVGRLDAAASVISEGSALAEARGERHNMVRFDVAEALRRLFSGDVTGAGQVVDRSLLDADVSGVRPAHVVWLGLASQIAQLEGRFDVAERRASEAVRMADHVDDFGSGGFVRGDLCALAAEFEREVSFDPKSSPIGLARFKVRMAPDTEYDALAVELARMTVDGGYVLWAPMVAREATRRGAAPMSAGYLGELAGGLEGPFVAAIADHAQGVLAEDLDRVEAAARSFLDMRCVVPAVDAGLDAVELALRFGPSAPLRRALLEFARVMALITPEAPPKFSRRFDDLVDRADMPSARQLEIATLAASGRSSKDIAAELHLSVRTVDNHLAAVYRSLDVSSRDELAELGLG